MKVAAYLLLCALSMASPLAVAKVNSVLIEQGTFNMGCSIEDSACEKDEGPVGGVSVEVPTFRIDRYEVTVKEYGECIDSGACTRPKDFNHNKYCNFGHPDRGNHPVNCIDWQQAVDFCATRDGRLPTEAEWEKAARAGSKTAYPWGNTVDCTRAIVDDGKTFGSVPNEPDGCGEDRTWPIGSREPNAFGLYDMHGNAGEWIMNWYVEDAIARLYAAGDLEGPPETGRQRVVRGGSWDENTPNLRNSYRNVKPPVSGDAVYGSIGFRCTYDS